MTKPDSNKDSRTDSRGVLLRRLDTGLIAAEELVYAALSIMLLGGALIVLFDAGYSLIAKLSHDVPDAIKTGLDRLLLVFIMVELLGAVRATIEERKLVAEPFLIVGMIAAIKEIVVIAVDAKKDFGRGARFDDAMTAMGVLGALLVGFGITIYLQRRKEREPEE